MMHAFPTEKQASRQLVPCLLKKKKKKTFIYLALVLVAACKIFRCGMWNLVS